MLEALAGLGSSSLTIQEMTADGVLSGALSSGESTSSPVRIYAADASLVWDQGTGRLTAGSIDWIDLFVPGDGVPLEESRFVRIAVTHFTVADLGNLSRDIFIDGAATDHGFVGDFGNAGFAINDGDAIGQAR